MLLGSASCSQFQNEISFYFSFLIGWWCCPSFCICFDLICRVSCIDRNHFSQMWSGRWTDGVCYDHYIVNCVYALTVMYLFRYSDFFIYSFSPLSCTCQWIWPTTQYTSQTNRKHFNIRSPMQTVNRQSSHSSSKIQLCHWRQKLETKGEERISYFSTMLSRFVFPLTQRLDTWHSIA